MSLFSSLDALTSGKLLANVVPLEFDSKVTWFRTGLAFEGNMGRKLRKSIFEGCESHLAKAGTPFFATSTHLSVTL
jgi:hypothetical protein